MHWKRSRSSGSEPRPTNRGTGAPDARSCFFLVAVKAGGKYFCVVEDEDIVFVEVVEHVFEHFVFYLTRFSVEHHHAAFIAVGGRILGYFFGGKF